LKNLSRFHIGVQDASKRPSRSCIEARWAGFIAEELPDRQRGSGFIASPASGA
jgi:hypothetical protein